MNKRKLVIYLLAAAMVFSLSGCRHKKTVETETETETQSETQSETESESETETEKQTEKQTEKKPASSANTTTNKTTVKPSNVNSSIATPTPSRPVASQNSYGTDMCPYCYNQISLAPNGDGTTIYSVHVAQEKAWADTYGYGNDAAQNSNQNTNPGYTGEDTTTDNSNDIAQCPYCYQWYSVSDGSYDYHVSSENSNLGLPQGSNYITCPTCGNTYAQGIEYNTHYCSTQ